MTVNFGASLLARSSAIWPSVEPCWALTLQPNSLSKAGRTALRMNSPCVPPQMPIEMDLLCAQALRTKNVGDARAEATAPARFSA